MERREASFLAQEDHGSLAHDEDLSIVRNVTKKMFSVLNQNVKTCIKITKLVDAIASNQRTGWRKLTHSRLEPDAQRFKEYIESLQQNEEAWLVMKDDAMKSEAQHDSDSNAKLGECFWAANMRMQYGMLLIKPDKALAMVELLSVDRHFREVVVEPLKRHLIQVTPPDYMQLHQTASVLGQDALKVGENMKQELARLGLNAGSLDTEAHNGASTFECDLRQGRSWPISLLGISNPPRARVEDVEMRILP